MEYPKAFAVLGNAIAMEIEFAGHIYEHTWPEKGPGRMILLAGARPGRGDMLLLTKPRPKKKVTKSDYSGDNARTAADAIGLFETFAAKYAANWDKISLPNYKFKRFGKVNSITYYSTKWGKRARYIHEFKTKPQARINYTSSGMNPPVIMVTGSNLQITKRGIEG